MAHHKAAVTTVAALALMAAGSACPTTVAAIGTTNFHAATRPTASHTHPAPSHFTRGRVDNPWFRSDRATGW